MIRKRRVRVDFREMPDYTKPERYRYREYVRQTTDVFDGDCEDEDIWNEDYGLFHEEFGDN